jgi:hypothetical protein
VEAAGSEGSRGAWRVITAGTGGGRGGIAFASPGGGGGGGGGKDHSDPATQGGRRHLIPPKEKNNRRHLYGWAGSYCISDGWWHSPAQLIPTVKVSRFVLTLI